MIKVFYGMPQTEVEKYTQIKTEIINARNGMDEKSIQVAKDEIMQECRVYDFDPENTANLYTVKNGVATIPVVGMLVNKVDFCAAFFGETLTTYRFIQEATAKAEADPRVVERVYDINSGGGVVSGVDETAQAIRAGKKPSKAIVRDMAASAAFWIASATDEIVIASNAAFLGSIGVAVEIINRDKADEKNGVNRRTLTNTTSKDKRPNLSTEDGQAVLVKELDDIFNVFAESILVKRADKLSMESIQELAGRVLIAQEAIDYGLADSMATIEGSGEIVLKSGKAPLNADVNNTEVDMELQEFLDQNPKAKAEHEELLRTANVESEKEAKEALTADRERSAKIAKLYGNGEMSIKAINEGTSVGELAVAEKENAIEASKKVGDQNLGVITPTNQVPEKVVEPNSEESKDKKAESDVKAYLDSQKKGVK